MRLDKFLQVSRLVRRRTVAQDFIQGGRVLLAGRAVKPAAEVHVGAEITLRYGTRTLTVRVLEIPERMRSGKDSAGLYEVVREERVPPEGAVVLGEGSRLDPRGPDSAATGAGEPPDKPEP